MTNHNANFKAKNFNLKVEKIQQTKLIIWNGMREFEKNYKCFKIDVVEHLELGITF